MLVVEEPFQTWWFYALVRRGHTNGMQGSTMWAKCKKARLTRRMMDLVTGGGVKWRSIGSPVERYVFQRGSSKFPDDPAPSKRVDRAISDEQSGIRTYFRDLRRIQVGSRGGLCRNNIRLAGADWLIWPGVSWPAPIRVTTRPYDSRSVPACHLGSSMADYGTPPAASALGLHGTVAADFLHGGYYPVGGAQEISDHVASIVKSQGGDCLVSSPVSDIIINNGIAQGVRITKKHSIEEYFAPVIVSNAGCCYHLRSTRVP